MDHELREALIHQYCEGPGVVSAALAGATEAELDARPGPNEWSAREVVHHLADSEATSYIRIRKLLAEDDAVIYGYDEAEFARAPPLRPADRGVARGPEIRTRVDDRAAALSG